MFAVFALGGMHAPISGDVWSAELGAWQLATTGEPWIDDVTPEQLPDQWTVESSDSGALWTAVNLDNGHRAVARSPGVVLVAVPAYAIDTTVSGPDQLRDLPGSLTAALLAAIAVTLLAAAASTLVPLRVALMGALALGLTTPMWSVAGNDLWPHSVTTLGLAGMAWAAARERWWLVGLFGGLGICGRLHLAVIVAVVGLCVALARRRPAIAVQVACTSLPFVGLCSVLGHWWYGSWSPSAGYMAGDLAAWPATRTWVEQAADVAGMFVSPGYGILIWTPCLLLMAPSVPAAWREAPDWIRSLAAGGLCYLIIQALLNPFHGGSGFWGYRLPLEALCAAFPLLVLTAGHMGRRARAAFLPIIGFQLAVMVIGVMFGRAHTNTDGSPWRSNIVLDALFENPPAFLTIVALSGLAVWFVGRTVLGRPPGSARAADLRPAQRNGAEESAS
ncbi:hypothetical protein ACOACQ_01600 [Nocardioides sp. CPCC 206347]|uniref:hypothetical protein n=1 Tax=unclassified Nocardioides TaxID=2615069 RepID=UPI00360A179A